MTNITFVAMSRHMEPNIRHQPVKMSDVFRLPPMPKARGEVIVSTARIKYRSAISIMSLNVWNMTMMPQITTSSQEPVRPPKEASSANVISTASGISRSAMTVEVIFNPNSQICGLATRRKENANVRVKSSFGSSASKPSPAAMPRVA